MSEATSPKPAATSQTKPNHQGQVTQAAVLPKRKVTYLFDVRSTTKLQLPYAVAVNGAALPAFSAKPKRVIANKVDKIEVFVDQGAKVALFLNSDAHPSYRRQAVYEVVVEDRDIVVTVTEKSGKHSDPDKPVRQATKDPKQDAGRKLDEYSAPLTGDIWMKISHAYEPAEVDGLVPAGTSPAVLAAVKSIYAGLGKAELSIAEPAQQGKPARALKVQFNDSGNPKSNIINYELLKDGLPRVHPGGYAALFNAALENSIESLRITSCWRPLLGSIAHRAGLGLDVDYVGSTWMNREELREGKANGKDSANVSDDEVKRFKEFEDAAAARKKADAEVVAANAAASKPGLGAEEKLELSKRIVAARVAQQEAIKAEARARRGWEEERDLNEPAKLKLYRISLLKCSCVAQLFDPWFMDLNTSDDAPPEPNMQRGGETSNERLHAHHLHVTVREPKIL